MNALTFLQILYNIGHLEQTSKNAVILIKSNFTSFLKKGKKMEFHEKKKQNKKKKKRKKKKKKKKKH